jgi:hypothetical protein
MTIDPILGIALVLAGLFRLHRNEMDKAEERYEKCDKERVLLHNVFYQNAGADFSSGGGAPEQLIEREPETPKSRMEAEIERVKLQLKSAARTRPAQLGRQIKRIERRQRPNFKNIRPAMDPGTAQVAKDQVGQLFADVRQQVNNGRNTDSGG